MNEKHMPLEGVKVVELGTHVAVPNATRFLADWGAEVIKVEGISGDAWRIVGRNQLCPILDDENPLFTLQNANKKFVSINLKDPCGKEIFLKLVSQCDIFVTNVRMKSLVKMGLDDKSLLAKFPSLVYGHFTGYGYEGPDAAKPGFDTVAYWARSGPIVDWGSDDGFPFLPPTGAGDATVGSILCSGLLAAYIGAKKTGKGTLVSSSLFGSAIWYNGSYVLSTQFGNKLPKSKDRPNNPLGYPYQCRDGEWLFIGIADYNGSFPVLCHVLGLDDIINDERFSQITNVRNHIDEFMPILRAAFMKKDRDTWVEEISAVNLVCGKVGHINDLRTDPQALANKYIVPVTFPNGETVDMPTVPILFGSYDTCGYDPTGVIGRDTDDVLEHAGYSPENIASARADGAIK